MRLVQFTRGGDSTPRPGFLEDSGDILDLHRAGEGTTIRVPESMTALLARPD